MFTPPLDGSQNSSRLLDLGDQVADDYFHSLTPVDLIDVELAEVTHTLYSDAATLTADFFPKLAEHLDEISGWYRDAAGTLVAHERHEGRDRQRLWLLWPTATPIVEPTADTVVESGGEQAFVRGSGAGPIVPLPAATIGTVGFTWGYHGTGPLNLYRALVHATTGQDAPIPPVEANDLPFSLLGWIHRLEQRRPWQLTWPDLVTKVEADRPIREKFS